MAEVIEGLIAREGYRPQKLLASLPRWNSMHWEECSMPPGTTKQILQGTIKHILCIGSTETTNVFARLTKVNATWTPNIVAFAKDECKFTVTTKTLSLELGEIVDKQGEASPVVLHSPFCDMIKFPTTHAKKKSMDLIRWYFLARGEITSIGKSGLETYAPALCKALESLSSRSDVSDRMKYVPIRSKADTTQDGGARGGEDERDCQDAEPLEQPRETQTQMIPDEGSARTEHEVLCRHIVRRNLAHVPDALPIADVLQFQPCDDQHFLPLKLLVGHDQEGRGVYARLLKKANSPYELRYTGVPRTWLLPFNRIDPRGFIASNVDEIGVLIKYYFIAKGASNDILVREGGGFETQLMLVFGEMAKRMNLQPINNDRDCQMPHREDSAVAVDLSTDSVRTPAANLLQSPGDPESPVQQASAARTPSPQSSAVVQSASETSLEGMGTPQTSVPADSLDSGQSSNTSALIKTPAETSAPASVMSGTDIQAEGTGFDTFDCKIANQRPIIGLSNE